MKKKLAIANMVLMLVVLLTMAIQAVHTASHILTELSTEKHYCTHHHGDNHHHADEDCSLCDFVFAYYVSPGIFSYGLYSPPTETPYEQFYTEIPDFFPGSLYNRRGPPLLSC